MKDSCAGFFFCTGIFFCPRYGRVSFMSARREPAVYSGRPEGMMKAAEVERCIMFARNAGKRQK